MTSKNIFTSSDSEGDVDYIPNKAANCSSSDEKDISEDTDLNAGHLTDRNVKTIKRNKKAKIRPDSFAKVDEKQRASDLWENFLNDVESTAPKNNSHSFVCNSDATTEIQIDSSANTIKINNQHVCTEFEFAGETVTVCDKDLNFCGSMSPVLEKINSKPVSKEKKRLYIPKKRGIDSVLGTIITKNKKLSILDKTLIDWKMFKRDEDLDDDLKKFNKGKQGFIERQRFLERSELRSFEIEKSRRQSLLKK